MDNRDMTGWEDYMNNNAIQIFKNEEFGEVRTVFENDGVWFIARDVATILGYKKPENAIANHVDDEDKTSILIQGSSSNYKSKTVLINESGLYSLVLSSKLPSAKRFKHWVTHEVIPTARRITCALETVSFQGNIDGLVYSKNGTATTTSRKIAEVFGKSHKEVLRLIDDKFKSTAESAQFCADHIIENIYINSRNRQQREYELDEQGFSYIALGLTGYKADEFKIKYINAFSKMRQALQKMVAARIVEDVLPQDSRNRQYVYVIENTNNGAVKIGVAHDPEARLKQLQTGSVDELRIAYTSYLCSNAFQVESFMHQHFADSHIRGEWYQADVGEVVDVLEKQTYVLRSNFNNTWGMFAKITTLSIGS